MKHTCLQCDAVYNCAKASCDAIVKREQFREGEFVMLGVTCGSRMWSMLDDSVQTPPAPAPAPAPAPEAKPEAVNDVKPFADRRHDGRK